MPGHSRPEGRRASRAYAPGIHTFLIKARRGWQRKSGLPDFRKDLFEPQVGYTATCGNKPGHDGLFLAGDRLPADIAAAEAAGPVDAIDAGISALLRLAHRLAAPADIEHAPTIGQNTIAVLDRAGVENLDALGLRRLVEALDDRAFAVVTRVAFGRHHHGESGIAVPAQVEILQLAVARGDERRHQIRHQPQHQHLTLRVAETDVVFDELRPLGGD